MSTAALTDQQNSILDAYRNTQGKIRELQDVCAHLKAQLLDAIGDATDATNEHGVVVLTHRPVRTFDATKAAHLLTDDQFSECVLPDPKLVRMALTGAQVESCMVEGSPRFVVAK